MGVKNGSKFLHSCSKLTLSEVSMIANALGRDNNITPRVVVDCSNVVFVYNHYLNPTDAVAKFLSRLAAPGLVVVPVCDGPNRPVAKQATHARNAAREVCRIASIANRHDIRLLKQQVAKDPNAEREELNKKIQYLSSKLKANERQATTCMPRNFVVGLDSELDHARAYEIDSESAGGYVEKVVVSEFQADAYMIGQIASGSAVMALTQDTDIPLLAGDCCVSINVFTKGSYTIVSTSASAIKRAMLYLPTDSKAEFHPAEIPLFDGVADCRVRALFMLILGCDVYTGLKGIGPKSLEAMVNECHHDGSEAALLCSLKDKFMEKSKPKLTLEAVETYIDAIVHEPSNAIPAATSDTGVETDQSYRTYMFNNPPSRLPQYLKEFTVDHDFKSGSNVFEGPSIGNCKGVGGCSHIFLLHEGHKKCTECNAVVCRSCQHSIDAKPFCLGCYASRAILPQSLSSTKSIAEMRVELKEKYNFDAVNDIDITEVEDVYESIGYVDRYNQQGHRVTFPLYRTSEINSTAPAEWRNIIGIDFKAKGAFLADPRLSANHIPSILKMFGSLVKFDSKTVKKSNWISDKSIHDTLPSILFHFARNCRVDSGYRLLQRCLRHTVDSKFPPIDKCKAILIDHQGEIGLHLTATVPASMKNCSYQSVVVATPTKILCVKCTCPCGSQDKERTVCVHNLPLLYSLTHLLFQDLADHIIREFAASMRCGLWDTALWSETSTLEVKRNLILLSEAAGEPVDKYNVLTVTIDELLEAFLVGTEMRREWKKTTSIPPKPFELGPIKNMSFPSTSKQGKSKSKRRYKHAKAQEEQPLPSSVSPPSDPLTLQTFTPDYIRVASLREAANCICKATKKYVGVRLLDHRSEQQVREKSEDELTELDNEMNAIWSRLQKLAERREIRRNLPDGDVPTCQPIGTSTPRLLQMRTDPGKSYTTPPTEQSDSDESPPSSPQKKKQKKVSQRCAKKGCGRTNLDIPKPKFHQIPSYPPPHKSSKPTLRLVKKRQGRILLHEEVCRRVLGEGKCTPADCKTKYYYCDQHEFETVEKSKTFKYDGVSYTEKYELKGVITGAGTKSSTVNHTTVSKGVARDRSMYNSLMSVRRRIMPQSEHVDMPAYRATKSQDQQSNANEDRRAHQLEVDIKLLESDVACTNLALQQVMEETNITNVPMNASLQVISGLGLEIGNASTIPIIGRNFTHVNKVRKKSRPKAYQMDPVVTLRISRSEVKRRTGFSNIKALLSCIFIACNGDEDKITYRSSSMTWFEEWFMHCEYQWGRSLTRIEDVTAVYGIHPREANAIITQKYITEFIARNSWPMYASFKEDMILRDAFKWGDKYTDERPVMWDMTNLPAYAFSDADFQRLTYSEYYGMNCFKGGVFVQLCGWMGSADLWPGRVTDSDYNRREGYLDRQHEFQSNDIVMRNGEEVIVPFMNIYDKGYHAHMAAWSHGRQKVLQPVWAKNGVRFTREETIKSASVATDRGGNERAVNVSKRAGYISRGFQPNMCPERFSIAWLSWAFKSNFMFEPVM